MNDQLSLFKSKAAEVPVDDPPKYVTAGFLSAILGISKKQVSNLKVKGVLPSHGENKYHLVECGTAYTKFIKKGQASKKTEMESAKLEKIERENKIAAGSLIDLNLAGQQYMQLASIMVEGLEALPPRATGEIAGESDLNIIQTKLFEQVRLIRETISKTVKDSEFKNVVSGTDKAI